MPILRTNQVYIDLLKYFSYILLNFLVMKTTNNTTAPAKMDAATIANTAAAMLKKHKTIAGIKAVSAASREKYGAANWAAIFARCKEFRAADIDAAHKATIEAVFTYRNVLGATYRTLAANSDYRKLCQYAAATYKGTDADTAAALVRDYYGNVDAETGAPLVSVDWADSDKGLIYTTFEAAELTAPRALSVLKSALNGLKAAAHKARRKAADNTATTADNKRKTGAIVAVYECGTGKDDTFARAACLAGKTPTTEPMKARAVASAAALVGRSVPAACVRLSELNAAARAAHKADADKALIEARKAATADAAAAGVKTTAPARKAGKAGNVAAATA